MFPSLLPATIEPVWCPVLDMEEEDALSKEELAFEKELEAIRKQKATVPIGLRASRHDEEEEELLDDDDDDDEMDDEMDELDESGASMDDDEEEEEDIDDEDEDDDDMGSDGW